MAKNNINIEIRVTDKNVKRATEDAAKGFRKMKTESLGAEKGFSKLRGTSKTLGKSFLSLKSAIAGVVAGYAAYKALGVAKTFLDVASSVENYRIRLTTLLGSQQAANDAMEFFNDIAAKTPATLGEVIESGTTLVAMGADFKKWIPVLNDLAAVMGMKMPEAASALGRAYAGGVGAADVFRDRGILQIIKDFAKLKYGIDDITKVEIPKFRDLMYEAFTAQGGKIQGAGDALAKGWTGMLSMVSDAWFRFRQKVMDSDVFLTLKESLKKFLDQIGVWKEEGKLDKWAEEVAAGTIKAFRAIAIAGGTVADMYRGIKMTILGVKEAILAVRHAVSEFVIFTSEKLGWKTVESLEVWKERSKNILKSLQDTNDELQRLAGAESAITKVTDAFDKLQADIEAAKNAQKEQAEGTKETAKEAGKAGKNLEYVFDGVKRVVGQTESATGNFVKMKSVTEEIVDSNKKETEELKKQIELLKQKVSLLAKASSLSGGGAKSYSPIEGMQEGGTVPGFGGGDRHLRVLEGGEEVLDKMTARFGRQTGLIAAMREAAGGGAQKGYFVLDHKFGGGDFPVKVIADDDAEKLLVALRRKDLIQG